MIATTMFSHMGKSYLWSSIASKNLIYRSSRMWHTSCDDHSKDQNSNSTLERIKQELEADKKAMQWRQPVGERPGDWNSKLKLFGDMEQTSDFIVMMQQPIDISPSSLKRWWQDRKTRYERHMQQYMPERHNVLGNDLAAAHFLLYRGGAVKFVNSSGWMRANKEREFDLPNKFDPCYKVEGLRCDNMNLYYEGLENLRCLQHLKFLSYRNVKEFDDWFLDRVSGSEYPILEVLDISGTKCTFRGLMCLYRIQSLKMLIVNDPQQSLEFELTCAALEQSIPLLKIVGGDAVHGINTNK